MALPDKQELLDEVDGLGGIPDSTLESIATAALIEFLQGSPLNPSGPRQYLITSADPLQCLKRQDMNGLFVRKLLDFLYFIATNIGGGGAGTSTARQFDTVLDMLADTSIDWGVAVALNYFVVGDGILSKWTKILDPSKTANGDDLFDSGDGVTLLWRTDIRQNS